MADPFISEIRIFGFNYAPQDWAFCDGSILNVQQNTPLFALIGNKYGGNGTTTFQLPDLRGQAAMCTSPLAVPPVALNEKLGAATVTLTAQQSPQHDHVAFGSSNAANATVPTAACTTGTTTGTTFKPYLKYTDPLPALVNLEPAAMASAGSGGAHENRQPYQILNFCICLTGVFPNFP